MGERFLDTEEVESSILSTPTKKGSRTGPFFITCWECPGNAARLGAPRSCGMFFGLYVYWERPEDVPKREAPSVFPEWWKL